MNANDIDELRECNKWHQVKPLGEFTHTLQYGYVQYKGIVKNAIINLILGEYGERFYTPLWALS